MGEVYRLVSDFSCVNMRANQTLEGQAMLAVISPAKTLDFESPLPAVPVTEPAFLDRSQALISVLRDKSVQEIASLMGLSDKLAALNVARYQDWQLPFSPDNARPAVLAFKGDVYQGLKADTLSAADHAWAQDHLRILSGLYGLLRPLDLIQPYRLEMGIGLSTPAGRNLYEFWGETLTAALNEALAAQGDRLLVNLASTEYFKAVKPKRLAGEIVTPVFKDRKNGQYKIISFFAKRARGLMAAHIIENRIASVDGLRAFDRSGYAFRPELSTANELLFTREEGVEPEENDQ